MTSSAAPLNVLLNSSHSTDSADSADSRSTLLTDLLKKYPNIVDSLSQTDPALQLKSGKRYLSVRVTGGRAFVDFLLTDEKLLNPSNLTLCCQFGPNRRSADPVPAAVEPEFKSRWLFPLQSETDDSPLASLNSLLDLDFPLSFTLFKRSQSRPSEVELLTAIDIEWRKTLVHGRLSLAVEFPHFNSGSFADNSRKLLGLLNLELEILPLKFPSNPAQLPIFVESKLISNQIRSEKLIQSGIEAKFHTYIKSWWQDFNSIRPQHAMRTIKLLAINEIGEEKFVCSMLQPIHADRCLESPLHAARFVRLIPHKATIRIGGSRAEIWSNPATLIAMRQGDLESHCLLLCSLLLGFGLDAFIAVGTNSVGQHVWVATRADGVWTFWDSLTGQRLELEHIKINKQPNSNPNSPVIVPHSYRKIYSMFNDKQLFANSQVEDDIEAVDFHLENPSLWKNASQPAISLLKKRAKFELKPSEVSAIASMSGLQANSSIATVGALESAFESELIRLVSAYRRQFNSFSTRWDQSFAYTLGPALFAYESERLSGICVGNYEFQSAIKHSVPVNSIFKAVPFQFIQVNPTLALTQMLQTANALDLLNEDANDLAFSLRVRIFLYPENVTAVWILIATNREADFIPQS